MFFPIASEAFNLGDDFFVFSVLFDYMGICISYRKVVVATPLVTLASRTSLILVFLARLALVGRRLLVLATNCVSKGNISELSLFRVFFLLFCRPVFS